MTAMRGWAAFIFNDGLVLLVPVRCGPQVGTAVPGFTSEAITGEVRFVCSDIRHASSRARYGAASRGAATLAHLLGCRSFVIEEDEEHRGTYSVHPVPGREATETRSQIQKALRHGGWTWNFQDGI